MLSTPKVVAKCCRDGFRFFITELRTIFVCMYVDECFVRVVGKNSLSCCSCVNQERSVESLSVVSRFLFFMYIFVFMPFSLECRIAYVAILLWERRMFRVS